jgi:aminopeptidase N
LVACSSAATNGGPKGAVPDEHGPIFEGAVDIDGDLDAVAYRVALRFGEDTRSFTLDVEASIRCTRSDGCRNISLPYAPTDAAVKRVKGFGADLVFEQVDRSLDVTLGRTLKNREAVDLKFEIEGVVQAGRTRMIELDEQLDPASPDNATAFGLLDANEAGVHTIYTFAWPDGASHWLPVPTDPRDGILFEIEATLPNDYFVVSNGALLGVTEGDQGKTWHYKTDVPMPSYGFALNASTGWSDVDLGTSRRGLPIRASLFDAARASSGLYADVAKALDFYEDHFGAYRWGSLRYVETKIAIPGQEHPTIPSVRPDLGAKSTTTAVHELAHHWSGDLVRISSWDDLWLSEGFAVYLTARYLEDGRGQAAAFEYLGNSRSGACDDPHAAAFKAEGQPGWKMWRPATYSLGAMVLRHIEERVGRAEFDAFLTRWFERHAQNAVTTDDFRADLKSQFGQSFDDLFDTWLYGDPYLELTAKSAIQENGKALLTLTPKVRGKLDSVKLAIDARGATETESAFLTIDVDLMKSSTSLELDTTFTPKSLALDPHLELMAKINGCATSSCKPVAPTVPAPP